MEGGTIDKTRDFNMASRKAEEAGQFVIPSDKGSLLRLFVFQDVYLMMITDEEKLPFKITQLADAIRQLNG